MPVSLRPRKSINGTTVAATGAATATTTRSGRTALGDVANTTKRKNKSDTENKAVKKAATKRLKTTTTRTFTIGTDNEAKPAETKKPRASKMKIPRIGRRRSPRLSGESSNSLSVQQPLPTEDDESNCLVPEQFRLQRSNFDNKSFTSGIAKHDEKIAKDELKVANYITDLFQNLYHEEETGRSRMYMDDQPDINAKMRSILIDWLVEVHMKFRLVPETLYLCVNIIDRYCSKNLSIKRSKLQLVGVTALFVACKYEEIYPPEVRDCVYITDRAYDRDEVVEMEQHILKILEWKIYVPTAYPFLMRFLDLCNASELARVAANYYLERTLQEHDMLIYRPSVVSAAAVIMAINNEDVYMEENNRKMSRQPGMPELLMEYTNFDEGEIRQCIANIAKKVSEEQVTMSNRQLIAVKRKYDQEKYQNISCLPNPSSTVP
eukprot:CAMPEP_0116020402 /NCGR_PEP_ID=MMETSP0321-20121206/9773_1 /TAXON_ID=163516 /ORGANISM="Leptocylindrus danicus var. danicus, Strain B650" /LENGTH=434 /DNA_ID=CAMNT_0003491081 /DNA_START=840 /DNA_END=2144 /DNA_ORIENTATION=-